MKKTLFIALVGALALGIAGAQGKSTSTTTETKNSPAYNWGFTYGTQGNNQCGTTNQTGKAGTSANQNLQDCNRGYVDGYNATHNTGNNGDNK